jgi:hypothetical protein
MQASEKPQFAQRVGQVLGFYGQPFNHFAVAMWWQACQEFELDQVAAALARHIADPERGTVAPMPADVVRCLQGTHSERSLLAWSKVLSAMQRVGAYSSVAFDDAAIHAAIDDLGGWPQLCREPLEVLAQTQRRFCHAYQVHVKAGVLVYPGLLLGESDSENQIKGRPVAPPVLVGDPVRAQHIVDEGARVALVAMVVHRPAAVEVLPEMKARAA